MTNSKKTKRKKTGRTHKQNSRKVVCFYVFSLLLAASAPRRHLFFLVCCLHCFTCKNQITVKPGLEEKKEGIGTMKSTNVLPHFCRVQQNLWHLMQPKMCFSLFSSPFAQTEQPDKSFVCGWKNVNTIGLKKSINFYI